MYRLSHYIHQLFGDGDISIVILTNLSYYVCMSHNKLFAVLLYFLFHRLQILRLIIYV